MPPRKKRVVTPRRTPDYFVDSSYCTVDGQDVTIDVSIGNGHLGAGNVRLGGGELATFPPRIEDLRVGSGQEIRGQILIVNAILNPTNPHTTLLLLTATLNGGRPTPSKTALKGRVKAPGQPLFFKIKVTFV